MSYGAWGDGDDSPFEAAIEKGWLNPDELSKAVIDVMNERDRQWNDEKFDAAHDDVVNADGQLIQAAEAYIAHNNLPEKERKRVASWSMWPWDASFWKPKNRRADLVRAAALVIAEIERLDRAAEKAQPEEKKQ